MREVDETEMARRAKILTDECEGILPYYEVFYIHSILYSAGRALEAFERFDMLLSQAVDPAYLISTIQEAVGHTAALSRYFWPSGLSRKGQKEVAQVREARGRRLRDAFGLGDDSPLRRPIPARRLGAF